MNKLLASTAIVGAMLLAAPAFAHDINVDVLNGSFELDNPTDVVLNGQVNLRSATTATGVDAHAKKVDVNVKNLDVTAVGNLNETVANGGGSTFDLTKSSSREASSSKSVTRSDKSLNVSYNKTVSRNRGSSYGNGTIVSTNVSASGSAWSKTKTNEHSRSGSKEFSISATSRNSVFVGSLQANLGSPTTAIGVDANAHKRVNVDVKNMNVTAVGNTNSTLLK